MSVSRMELADAGSPEKLVMDILKHEPDLEIPVPIHQLAFQLDITEIVPLSVEGYEGGLLTTPDKFQGIILYNEESEHPRQRFTIAHELGHFLMPSHIPSEDGQFLCSMKDMQTLAGKGEDRRRQMEVEANRFASLLLIPPPLFRADLKKAREPSLEQIVRLAARYETSKEAMARAYVQYREETVAIVLTKDGQLLRDYRHRRFPVLTTPRGATLPRHALLHRRAHEKGLPSTIEETDAGVWIDVVHGKSAPQFYEQVLQQRSGYAMTMLWLEETGDDDQDDEAELTAKERYKRRVYDRNG